MSYADVYRRSIEDPDGFWLEQAKAIDWDKAPTRRPLIRTPERGPVPFRDKAWCLRQF